MFSAIRKRLTPGTVIATIALLFAMTGGAYAAKKYLITSTKQISPSVLKALKGASGKAGPAGPAGPVGAAGAGTAGPTGPQGPAGPGGPGGPGGETGPQGPQGIQGKEGKKGEIGSPWTAGGTLPSNATETGIWGFGPAQTQQGVLTESIVSFPIPLAATATVTPHYINSAGEEVHVGPTTTPPTGCGSPVGTITEPKADPGNLCIYELSLFHAEAFTEGIIPFGKVGAQVQFFLTGVGPENEPKGSGSWAVTAP